SQDQGDTHEQQPQQRIPRTRPDPGLMQLAVTALDSETGPIGLVDPLIRRWFQPPIRIHQLLTAMTFPLPPIVAALDTDRHGRFPLLGIGQGITPPTTASPVQEDPGPTGAFGVLDLASPADNRHQKRMAAGLEITDKIDAVKPAIQQ